MTENEFRREAESRGYAEPRSVEYEPNMTRDLHTHDFSAFVLVVEGELILATPDGKQAYAVGETCEVPAGTVHAECTGPAGSKLIIAKR